jgi:DNA-binding transcriptional LysR family regulator
MRARLDSRSLRAFLAVAETLSFRQAAETLHVSQPPLSRTIKELEVRLGAKLFVRDTREVGLTSAGKRLLPKARRIVRLLQEAEDDLLSVSASKELRLGLTTAVEHGKLLESLERISERLGVTVSTVSDSSPRLVRSLRANRLDAAFIALPTETSGLEVKPLERQPMIVALGSKHALARRRRLSLADLLDERMFWFERARQPAFFDYCQKVFARHRFTPITVKEPLDHHVLLADVAAGRAIALLPRSFTTLQRMGVAYRPLREGEELAVGIGLAARSDRGGLEEILRWLSRSR